jgi:hypothetical protein
MASVVGRLVAVSVTVLAGVVSIVERLALVGAMGRLAAGRRRAAVVTVAVAHRRATVRIAMTRVVLAVLIGPAAMMLVGRVATGRPATPLLLRVVTALSTAIHAAAAPIAQVTRLRASARDSRVWVAE